mgnify:CR=1 FL=1|jgi:hypothetical protein
MLKKKLTNLLLGISMLVSANSLASLKEFDTTYVLSIPSFPEVEISHTLKNKENTNNWEIVLKGDAFFNQFSILEKTSIYYTNDVFVPTFYSSVYKAPFNTSKHVLTSDNLSQHIDRQSLFIQLSTLISNKECLNEECSITYFDHKSKKRTIDFIIEQQDELSYDDKNIPLNVIKGKQDDKDILIALHPEYAGMLLFMNIDQEYQLLNTKVNNFDIKSIIDN